LNKKKSKEKKKKKWRIPFYLTKKEKALLKASSLRMN
jgi:hypothetical protein